MNTNGTIGKSIPHAVSITVVNPGDDEYPGVREIEVETLMKEEISAFPKKGKED